MKVIERSAQKEENTWDLSQIYQNEEEIQQEMQEVKTLIEKLEKEKGHVMMDAHTLKKVLEMDTILSRKLEKLATYAYRKLDEDIANNENQERKGKIDLLWSEASTKTSFLIPEILKEKEEVIASYQQDPSLKDYSLLLSRLLRKKEHILSEEEERLLSSLSNILTSPSNIAGILRNSEIPLGSVSVKGEEAPLTNANYSLFIKDSDRSVRKNAFLQMHNSYGAFRDTFTETIQGEVLKNVRLAKLRGFSSAKEASLFSSRVPSVVYDNLIQTVHEKMDVIHRYFALKMRVSKLEDYALYDTYLNLVDKKSTNYSYEDAKKIVLDVVKVFGEDYTNIVQKAFNERWIDIYPNKGKRGGAYSSGSYDTAPYILLNYLGDYQDVSTLIHELGHSMHSYYSNKNNLAQYSSYKIFVAEVASTVNELLFNYYMLEHSKTKEEKMQILSDMMDGMKATLYRQTMFSEFESFMHEKVEQEQVLTSEMLCEKYYQLNQEYFGDAVAITNEIRYEWMRIPHFYYNFYVYQYATGLAAACEIVRKIRSQEPGAIEGYLKFLASGDSMDPIDELLLAGVDMRKKEVIENATKMFESWIDEFESLM